MGQSLWECLECAASGGGARGGACGDQLGTRSWYQLDVLPDEEVGQSQWEHLECAASGGGPMGGACGDQLGTQS